MKLDSRRPATQAAHCEVDGEEDVSDEQGKDNLLPQCASALSFTTAAFFQVATTSAGALAFSSSSVVVSNHVSVNVSTCVAVHPDVNVSMLAIVVSHSVQLTQRAAEYMVNKWRR